MSHADGDLNMPPKRERIPESVLANSKKWIETGTPDPRADNPSASAQAWEKASRDFWSYQPPRETKPPCVKDIHWPKRALDYFVLAKLERHELTPSPDAHSQTLLRRLRFVLVGLPPSAEDLIRFQSQIETDGLDASLAVEVDELLASSEFGKRWGRHWLDVARFAESSGS